jgi:hypothetical protein
MWLPRPVTEVLGMTMSNCCGVRPQGINVAMSDSRLTFVYCSRCEQRQWFRDGKPTTLTTATDCATREWNRKLAVR